MRELERNRPTAHLTTLRTIADLRAALDAPRRAGRTIGLVPTMGALHEGHLSLIEAAREDCDEVVVSLFVNPTQFDRVDDLQRYPRNEATDAELAAGAGADYLFAPSAHEMYPRDFATGVSVGGVSERLEGTHRGRAHFEGVATVVTKLLNIVQPTVAYFGQKDAQQALVIKRLVADLNFDLTVRVCPTVREPDGLARSSRNALLEPADRERALALSRALARAEVAVADGERDATRVAALARAAMVADGVEPEYLELVKPDTLAPAGLIDGKVLAVVAARVGAVRLIDNQLIELQPVPSGGRALPASSFEPSTGRS